MQVIRRHRDVTAVLSDPSFVVPTAEPAETGIGWLRFSVSRFTNGNEHAQRRTHVEAMVEELDTEALRREAAARTDALLDRNAGGVVDVMAALARCVPIGVLAEALAIDVDAGTLVASVTAMATAYPEGGSPEQALLADDAVERLVALLGGRDESTVIRLTLLAQMCDATAGLIGNSLNLALRLPRGSDTTGILGETLRYRPPVKGTRRIATAARAIGETTIEPGNTVLLDFDAANRDSDVFDAPQRFDPGRTEPRHLTFGYGFRACPGSDPALALAVGVVGAVLARCEATTADSNVEYEASPLRIPARLEVDVRRSTDR